MGGETCKDRGARSLCKRASSVWISRTCPRGIGRADTRGRRGIPKDRVGEHLIRPGIVRAEKVMGRNPVNMYLINSTRPASTCSLEPWIHQRGSPTVTYLLLLKGSGTVGGCRLECMFNGLVWFLPLRVVRKYAGGLRSRSRAQHCQGRKKNTMSITVK